LVDNSDLVCFSFSAGLTANKDNNVLQHRAISLDDVKPGMLHIGRLKGRHMSVAAAKFLDQLTNYLARE